MKTNYNNRENRKKDDYAIVLDIINKENNYKDSSLIQAIGTKTYSLLELIPKEGIEIKIGEKVYIGDGKREKIQYIRRTIFPEKLTSSAKSEILYTIIDIINEREKEYIDFINNAKPITIRKHALELIPGVGKKHLKDLLNIREEEPFKNFEDIKKRVPFISEPQKAIATRILNEINGDVERIFFIIR